MNISETDTEIFSIECEGFAIAPLYIPPFVLRPGEVVSIIWPLPTRHPIEKRLFAILTGKKKNAAVKLNDFVVYAEQPIFLPLNYGYLPLRRLANHYFPKLASFLRKRDSSTHIMKWHGVKTILSQEDETAICLKVGRNPEGGVGSIPGHPKDFLALDAAWSKARTIIFENHMRQSSRNFALIDEQLSRGGSAIEISYPIRDIVAPTKDCYPGSTQVEVIGWQHYTKNKQPTRQQTVQVLQDLLAGKISRDGATRWTRKYIDKPTCPEEDRLLFHALCTLAGANLLDRNHTGEYVHSEAVYKDYLEKLTSHL